MIDLLSALLIVALLLLQRRPWNVHQPAPTASAPSARDCRNDVDPALIKAVARGSVWFEDLATGIAVSITAIADRAGATQPYVRRLIQLAFLAPAIVEAILRGCQPVDLSAARLTGRIERPLDWGEQQQLVGI